MAARMPLLGTRNGVEAQMQFQQMQGQILLPSKEITLKNAGLLAVTPNSPGSELGLLWPR
jgi:hypothetical protein